MNLWLKARALRAVAVTALLSVLLVTLPATGLTATPSPGGATVAIAIALSLGLPVAIGWAMARGDEVAERISNRCVAVLDFGAVVGVTASTAIAEAGLGLAGLSGSGVVAATALLTFTGLLLLAQPFVGWRLAGAAPTVYFVAVVIAGRGDDAANPAPWAWVAAPAGVGPAGAALATLGLGAFVCALASTLRLHVPSAVR